MSVTNYNTLEQWFTDHVQGFDGAVIKQDASGEYLFYSLDDTSGDGVVVYVPESPGAILEYTYQELSDAIDSGTVRLKDRSDLH